MCARRFQNVRMIRGDKAKAVTRICGREMRYGRTSCWGKTCWLAKESWVGSSVARELHSSGLVEVLFFYIRVRAAQEHLPATSLAHVHAARSQCLALLARHRDAGSDRSGRRRVGLNQHPAALAALVALDVAVSPAAQRAPRQARSVTARTPPSRLTRLAAALARQQSWALAGCRQCDLPGDLHWPLERMFRGVIGLRAAAHAAQEEGVADAAH